MQEKYEKSENMSKVLAAKNEEEAKKEEENELRAA